MRQKKRVERSASTAESPLSQWTTNGVKENEGEERREGKQKFFYTDAHVTFFFLLNAYIFFFISFHNLLCPYENDDDDYVYYLICLRSCFLVSFSHLLITTAWRRDECFVLVVWWRWCDDASALLFSKCKGRQAFLCLCRRYSCAVFYVRQA